MSLTPAPRPILSSESGLSTGTGQTGGGTGTGASRGTGTSAQSRRRTWHLVPLAPAIVVVIGLAVAVAIGVFGITELASGAEEQAGSRAELLASTLGATLSSVTPGDRLERVRFAAHRASAEFAIAHANGAITAYTGLSPPEPSAVVRLISDHVGSISTRMASFRFATTPIGNLASSDILIAFVRVPRRTEGVPALLRALIAMTTLLVGVAAAVAYAVARDASRDVTYIAKRVRGMVRIRSEPTGEPIAVRTMDEVGALTSAFNQLVARFTEAQKTSRDNLDRVRSADRDRSAFLAAISHELRSPLNAILGFAEILMTEVDGPLSPGAREEVEQIRGSGQHLLELINDILEFSALESGQLRLTYTRVDLILLANQVVREATGVIGDRPLVLRVEAEPGAVAYADLRRTRQIVTNLVGNAVKFTPQGEVVVSVGTEGRYGKVEVRDTGPGISPAERAVIFDEYRQTREERRRRRGTGLGLAIALRLALIQGGTIRVDSEIGKGSVFKVLLPRTPPESPKRRRSSQSRSAK